MSRPERIPVAAIPVTIHRPAVPTAVMVGKYLGLGIRLLLRAWVVMLLVPIVWQPVGFWWCVAALAIVTLVLDSGGEWLWWTKSGWRRSS